MDTSKQAPRDLFERIRTHRLTATFALLATLSVGILAGSLITRGVSGKEQTVDSSDARPLTVPNPVNLSNDFSKIAKQVGPAVVNINTITLPKESATRRSPRRGQASPNGGDDNNPDAQAPGDIQDFLNLLRRPGWNGRGRG